jgi:hypothetical protein
MQTHNLRWTVPKPAAPFVLEELNKAWGQHGFTIAEREDGADTTNIVVTVPISGDEDAKQKETSFGQLVEAIVVIGSHRDPNMFA